VSRIAIMQPYIFPYIGYFQLINAVDKFILFDFDGSNTMYPLFNYSTDVYKFLKSIKHNTEDKWNNIICNRKL
jgi:cobalamin biosynthesis Co2+ chelatase CbiK